MLPLPFLLIVQWSYYNLIKLSIHFGKCENMIILRSAVLGFEGNEAVTGLVSKMV